ncbi:MAG: N-6 DNA methylase [Chloroherpetonaceae bacterium]|nr:N-6 DNA methylase [Chloroherpetonaceae bacterium]
MGSLTRRYSSQKLLGQVYTPRFIVEKILSDIGFNKTDVLGKTILDPACGDGSFLTVVAQQIIELSPKENLKENLEKIYGWDISKEAVRQCIENLNKLTEPFSIQVSWNIQVCNALRKVTEPNTPKFDFIVGNPPYIRIQHLTETERTFIKTHYMFCRSGSTDAYIAFFELCNTLLAPHGICGLITPNTYFYSETARFMRNYFSQKQTLIKVTNYGNIQLFEHATTYSAITIFNKQPKDAFIFEQAITATEFESRKVHFDEIKNRKIWQLSSKPLKEPVGVKLKDICRIHVGITTLCDKAYIFPIADIQDEPNYVFAKTHFKGLVKLERAILKPIIKASKLKSSQDEVKEYILFPYQKVNGKHRIIPEEKLKSDFPLAYRYLLSIKEELDKRDNGKPNPVAWYAFGRSQGLDTSFGKKILFSPMNHKPNFILVENEDAAFYSGYCIKYDGDYEFLLEQLNSERFAHFVATSSRDFRGGWKAYNKKILEQFTVLLPEERQGGAKNIVNLVGTKVRGKHEETLTIGF